MENTEEQKLRIKAKREEALARLNSKQNRINFPTANTAAPVIPHSASAAREPPAVSSRGPIGVSSSSSTTAPSATPTSVISGQSFYSSKAPDRRPILKPPNPDSRPGHHIANKFESRPGHHIATTNKFESRHGNDFSSTTNNFEALVGRTNAATSHTRQTKASCSLIARDKFEVHTGYHDQLIKVFKTLKTGSYNAKTRIWSFHLSEHDALVQAVGRMKGDVELTPLPRWVLDTFKNPKEHNLDLIDLSSIEPAILESLMPFQRRGIQYGISRGGRVMIADDMGLGKTIQALGLASYYRDYWPFLVVAPSSMRYAWRSAILRWLPHLDEDDIITVATGKDYIGSESAVIISYDLLGKKNSELMKKRFNFIIMDESHLIKNDKSARTKAAEPLMRESRYLVLLSGTPALSRPIELYSQISALQPRLFKFAKEFGFRYCDGQVKKFGLREVCDFSGSSHMEELSLLLQERCMIRRLKSDVLNELPAKQRCMVILDPGDVNSTSKIMQEKEKAARKAGVHGMEKRGLLLEWYSATAQAKLKAVQKYVQDLLAADRKFLLFCHHGVMIKGLAEVLESSKTDFIQIDGGTPSEQRKALVDRFQTAPNCKVALLSITAANSGLTLTSAHLVVFAEIYWNPGILTQAEDRAHRIGQTDSVIIQYLVAKGTADDELWPMIQKKLDVLNKAGLSKDNFEESESKVLEDPHQKKIEDFFHAEQGKQVSKESESTSETDDSNKIGDNIQAEKTSQEEDDLWGDDDEWDDEMLEEDMFADGMDEVLSNLEEFPEQDNAPQEAPSKKLKTSH